MGKQQVINLILRTIEGEYVEQLGLYHIMRSLCAKQRDITLAKKYEDLESLLGERQKIIDDLAKANEKIRPMLEEVAKSLGLDSFHIGKISLQIQSEEVDKLQDTLRLLRDLLEEIKEMDSENEELLRKELEEPSNPINRVSPGVKKAINLYRQRMKDTNSFSPKG